MAVGVDYSAWLVHDGELKRRHVCTDKTTKQYAATVYFDCKIERGIANNQTFLSFMITPFRVVDGLDLGLSLAPLDGGRSAPVSVNVTSVDNGQGALMSPRTPQGLRQLLSQLMLGDHLKLGIWQGPEQLVDLPFYNDAEFIKLYMQLAERLAGNESLLANPLQSETRPSRNALGLPSPGVQEDSATKSDQPNLHGFEIGEALAFLPLQTMARIVDLEEFEGADGPTHRFIIELDDDEIEMRIPVGKLRDLLSRKRSDRIDEPNDNRAEANKDSSSFKFNEFVVYPAHGVGQILAIEEQDIAGAKLELFVINFIKDNMTLRVPTAKVAQVGMRKLSEPALVKKALETLKRSARTKNTMWSRRAQEHEAKINSGDIVAIAEVIRDLYRSESQAEQSYSERQLYEAAFDRLSREIAVVQHLTETEAAKEIDACLHGGASKMRPS